MYSPHMLRSNEQNKMCTKEKNSLSLTHYVNNHIFALGIIEQGLGCSSSWSICGYLGMKNPWHEQAYANMEREICQLIITNATEITKDN